MFSMEGPSVSSTWAATLMPTSAPDVECAHSPCLHVACLAGLSLCDTHCVVLCTRGQHLQM